jgi:hypothetical protein
MRHSFRPFLCESGSRIQAHFILDTRYNRGPVRISSLPETMNPRSRRPIHAAAPSLLTLPDTSRLVLLVAASPAAARWAESGAPFIDQNSVYVNRAYAAPDGGVVVVTSVAFAYADLQRLQHPVTSTGIPWPQGSGSCSWAAATWRCLPGSCPCPAVATTLRIRPSWVPPVRPIPASCAWMLKKRICGTRSASRLSRREAASRAARRSAPAWAVMRSFPR